MPNFDDIWQSLRDNVLDLVKNTFTDFKDQAIKDTEDFLSKTKADLQNWTEQLINNKITQVEFEDLVKGQKDLAEMVLLKQAGLALIEIDKFKKSLINTILGTIIKLIK